MAMGVGPRLRGVVLRALVARGVGAALREREALDRERAALLAQLAPGPVAWDAAAPGHHPGVHARLAAIDTRRLALSEALGRAFVEIARECPPFEIVTRVEAAIDLALRERAIGVEPGGAADALAEELDALAWRLADLWAPGFDPDAVAAAFADRSVWSRARPDLGPPREDDRLGWAAVGPDEVLARAATSAAGEAFVALCASATREAAEAAEVAAQLEEARGEVSHLAAIVGLGLEKRRRVDELAIQLTEEQHEAKAAFETAWLAAMRAAEVTPPLAIHGALLAASAVLRGAGESWDLVVQAEGTMARRTSRCGRALVLAALADVRAACERAFPGLCTLASGGPSALRAITGAERGQGPYRVSRDEASPATATDVAPGRGDHDAQLLTILDGLGAPAAVARALEHGAVLGAIEPRPGRSGVADRLVARSAPGDAGATHVARATWHRAFLLAQRRSLVVGCARPELPRTLLHEALVQAHWALQRVWAHQTERRLWLTGKEAAVQAAERLAFTSGDLLGVPTRPWDLAATVAARLHGGPPGAPAVEVLASELRPTSFARAFEELARLEAAAVEARRAAGRAAEAVSWIERFNVFTRSPSERAVDDAAQALTQVEREAREAMTVAQNHFVRAVARHPVLALHVGTGGIVASVCALLPVAGVFGDATVGGLDHAWKTLHAWGQRTHAVLGGLEPAASVLERYATAKLRARQGFAA